MLVNRRRILVQFGDCDPGNIVFYANYFRWFDECTAALFQAAGLPIHDLFKSYGVWGIPLVDARARFISPSTYGDEMEVESSVIEWRNSSFVVGHNFYRNGGLLVEGSEIRVWAAPDPANPERKSGVPVPKEVVAKLS